MTGENLSILFEWEHFILQEFKYLSRSMIMFWFRSQDWEQIHRFSFGGVDRFFDLNEQIHQNLAYDLKKLRFKRTQISYLISHISNLISHIWVGFSLSLWKRLKLKVVQSFFTGKTEPFNTIFSKLTLMGKIPQRQTDVDFQIWTISIVSAQRFLNWILTCGKNLQIGILMAKSKT